MPRPKLPTFSLFAPPYRDYLPLDPDEGFTSRAEVLWGVALVWSMEQGRADRDLDLAADRPGGLPLVVVLPRAVSLRRVKSRVLEVVEEARPQSILPYHPWPDPEELAHLLRHEPDALAGELLDFLRWRGLYLDQETRRIVRRIVELSAEVTTLSAVARGVYLSRRALGRRFKDRGLPVPSHWLQFCRLLRAAIRLQNSDVPLFDVARSLGYPDGFTLSNQMERILAVRPSFVRERLGWEWIVEAWLRQERRTGGLRLSLRGETQQGSENQKGDGGQAAVPPSGAGSSGDPERSSTRDDVSGAERSGAAA